MLGYYCETCRTLHKHTELCPSHVDLLKKDPTLLPQAGKFTSIAAQYRLVTSGDFECVIEKANKLIGSNLRYEGTHQIARDLQVFKRLNEEAYRRIGSFATPEAAQEYFRNATTSQSRALSAKLAGAGQEVDWLRLKQSEIGSILNKSTLFNKNAVGVDGQTVSRFTGKTISRTTIKAAQTRGGQNTNVQGIVKAIKSGTLSPHDRAFIPEGTGVLFKNKINKEVAYAKLTGDKEAVARLMAAKENLKIEEYGEISNISSSVDRLKNKIADGKAVTSIPVEQVTNKIAQGAIIGAAVALTISGITSYMRYRNGELTKEQAFIEVGEDALKGTIIGAGMGALTLFLPGGAIGFCAGVAIGMYVNAALTNVLDEIFGKGAYLGILTSSGCVLGVSQNLVDLIDQMESNIKATEDSCVKSKATISKMGESISDINKLLEG